MTQDTSMNDPQVTTVEGRDGCFRVQSRTRRDRAHAVDVPEGMCSCEAGQHGVECWHLDFCRAVYYWHRYDQRAQLWHDRAARVHAATVARPSLMRPESIRAVQQPYAARAS